MLRYRLGAVGNYWHSGVVPRAGLPDCSDRDLTLTPAADDAEIEALRPILVGDAVHEWWGPDPVGDLVTEPQTVVLAHAGGGLVGVLQCHEETYDAYPSVSFDIALGPQWQGRGLGPRVLTMAMRHYAAGGHHRFTIDPARANGRAIAAYERAGFAPVGLLRAYERTISGGWRDGWLMEAIAWDVPAVAEYYVGTLPGR